MSLPHRPCHLLSPHCSPYMGSGQSWQVHAPGSGDVKGCHGPHALSPALLSGALRLTQRPALCRQAVWGMGLPAACGELGAAPTVMEGKGQRPGAQRVKGLGCRS